MSTFVPAPPRYHYTPVAIHPSGASCTWVETRDRRYLNNYIYIGKHTGEVLYRIINDPAFRWWAIPTSGNGLLTFPATRDHRDWDTGRTLPSLLSGRVLQLEFLAYTEGYESPRFYRPQPRTIT